MICKTTEVIVIDPARNQQVYRLNIKDIRN